MGVTFDGKSKSIVLDTEGLRYTSTEIYSRWKQWANEPDNGKWAPAFRVVGGDDLGDTLAPAFFFVRNDYGWTIKRPEASIEVEIDGNIVFEQPNGMRFSGPDGNFSPVIEISLSSVATSDLRSVIDALSAVFTPEMKEQLRRVYIAHYHKRSRLDENITLYAADGVTPLYTFEAADDGTLIDPRFNPTIDTGEA